MPHPERNSLNIDLIYVDLDASERMPQIVQFIVFNEICEIVTRCESAQFKISVLGTQAF